MLTLIRGLPGSGKTTLARQIAWPNDRHIEADQFFESSDGEYDFSQMWEMTWKSIHNVPEQTIEKMRSRWEAYDENWED